MKGYLTRAQIEYVLFHVSQHVQLTDDMRSHFHFVNDPSEISCSNRIVFVLSSRTLDLSKLINIDGIPVLYPVSEKNNFYFFDSAGNLVFSHDLLKSVFYLLSGYQEYADKTSVDKLNRFSFHNSIQHKLNLTSTPIVNYYIRAIIDGVQQFFESRNSVVRKRRLFENFGFLLSHDVDAIDMYTSNYIIYKAKELLKIKPTKLSSFQTTRLLLKAVFKYLGLVKKDNPYWNFEFLRKLETDNNFRSTFYFLDQGIRHSDAYYSFTENRVRELFKFLKKEDCEIGLHGSVESVHNREKMNSSLIKLTRESNSAIVGNRQHRLLWNHPDTALIQQSLGLKYDTTLGFAAHEGFRNSYCLPFKLFDFEKDKIIDLWEFPLNVMDVTLFAYQGYRPAEALEKTKDLISEVKKFGGIFTLLWHNSFFDEPLYPGITHFYKTLLSEIASQKPQNLLGSDLLQYVETYSSQHE